MISVLGGEPGLLHACSRSKCEQEAVWAILWRNPKIHAAERRKTWLACGEHLGYLREFLAARSFPLEVLPVEALKTADLNADDMSTADLSTADLSTDESKAEA